MSLIVVFRGNTLMLCSYTEIPIFFFSSSERVVPEFSSLYVLYAAVLTRIFFYNFFPMSHVSSATQHNMKP